MFPFYNFFKFLKVYHVKNHEVYFFSSLSFLNPTNHIGQEYRLLLTALSYTMYLSPLYVVFRHRDPSLQVVKITYIFLLEMFLLEGKMHKLKKAINVISL